MIQDQEWFEDHKKAVLGEVKEAVHDQDPYDPGRFIGF